MTDTAGPRRGKASFERSVGAVIFRQAAGKILYLLLHYEDGHWGSAKGHIEAGEIPEETARREIREETGLTEIQFSAGFKEEITYFFRDAKGLVRKSVVYFLAETSVSDIKLSEEHVDFVWLPYAEALEKITFKDEKAVFQKAANFLKTKNQ